MTNSFKWLYEKVSLIQYLEKICAISWHIHSPESGGLTRDTALSDRNPETYNTACCSVCRSVCRSAWTAQHSLFCSISHILLSHEGLRKTCNLQTEGCRRQSVIPTFYLLHCMTALYTNIPITDSPGKNVETSRCSKLSAEKCKWLGKCNKWLRKCIVNDWRHANDANTAHGKCDGESCTDVGRVTRGQERVTRQIKLPSRIGEKRKRQVEKRRKSQGYFWGQLYKLSYKFLINSKNSQYICWKLQ